MTDIRFTRRVLAGLLLFAALAAAPAPARATDLSTSRPPLMISAVYADSVTFRGFVRYWKGFANRADRVVLIVALVAASALFIITRGKWLK